MRWLVSAGALGCALAWAVTAHAQAVAAPEPLTLAQARALALMNHPDIAAADYRAQAAHEVYVQSRAGLLPQVSLYGDAVHAGSDATRLLAGGLNNPSVYDRTAVGVGASQLISDFGHTANLAASSRLEAQAAQQGLLSTRAEVLLAVDHSYLAALQARAVVQVAQQTLATRELLAQRVGILAQNKLRSQLDVSFAQVATEDARLLLQQAQADADSAQASLSAVLGYREPHAFALADEAAVATPEGTDLAGLIAQALQDRPELAALRDEREAAERRALAQRDARLPTVSAVLDAGTALSRDARLPANYTAAGIEVSVPLFAGGLYEGRAREASLRAKAAERTLRSLEDTVARDVNIAWLGLASAREQLRTSLQLRRYAATAYELADARYRAGSSSIVELSQAQLALTSAQIGEAGARYEVLRRAADLNYQVGAGMEEAGTRATPAPGAP
jgi:outer membrane protein